MHTDPFLDSYDPQSPFNKRPAYSMLGQKVIDERLSVTSDCMDPDLGYPPFENHWITYYPATWIEDGVLKTLIYGREYAVKKLGIDSNGVYLWGSGQVTGSYHMRGRGPTASVEEMIANTPRGILVTRFSDITYVDFKSATLTGYTRDGLWLIEKGKISKPIKNFRFTDSPLAMLNSVEQIGVPERVYNPTFPIVVPALKVRDFNFTALSDSV
jgi:predicted Zn-dependent protease